MAHRLQEHHGVVLTLGHEEQLLPQFICRLDFPACEVKGPQAAEDGEALRHPLHVLTQRLRPQYACSTSGAA